MPERTLSTEAIEKDLPDGAVQPAGHWRRALVKRFLGGLALTAVLAGSAWAGELRVGAVGDYQPFNFVGEDGELQGFDVDIAAALCDRLGVRCRFVRQEWERLIPALREGLVDMVAASMSITEERRRLVTFTNRYYSNNSRFAAHEAARFDPGAAAGRAVGAMRGTIASAWLEKNMPEAVLRFYGGPDDLLRDLGANKLDAVFSDELGLHAWLKNHPGFGLVGPRYSLDEGIGIAVRKEDVELRQDLNAALAEILADGTYEKINAKYFPFSIY